MVEGMGKLAHAAPEPAKSGEPKRLKEAAAQFEAILIGQMLRSAREEASGSGDAALEFAEQQMSQALATAGGLGLARLVVDGLEQRPPSPNKDN